MITHPFFSFDDPDKQDLSTEWYTPPRVIEAVRAVMKTIDLDPASCAEANQIVKATRYYTRYENGLVMPLYGSVFVNPPYGKSGTTSRQQLWVNRLIGCYQQGQIEQAILLCTADTDEKWFQPLWDYPLCFADHHLYFSRPGKIHEKQMFGTAWAYLGPHIERFAEVFSAFGPVVLSTRRKKIAAPRQSRLEWEAT